MSETSLRTVDLISPLKRDSVRVNQVLYIIDTCHAEAGAIDLTSYIAEVIRKHQNVSKESKTIGCIAACRVKQLATESVFASAFTQVLEKCLIRTDNNLFIPPTEIIKHINEERFDNQRANCTFPGAETIAAFFPIIPKELLTWQESQEFFINETVPNFRSIRIIQIKIYAYI